jgi:hypothetical protein
MLSEMPAAVCCLLFVCLQGLPHQDAVPRTAMLPVRLLGPEGVQDQHRPTVSGSC